MTSRNTAIDEAVASVRAAFPFPDYFDRVTASHAEIARVVTRLLPPGAPILDFASGPLDKTAVLARLGYRMTAYDDLLDEWHQHRDNRVRILAFGEQEGIEYVVGPAPIPAGPFAMVMAHDVIEHLPGSPRHLLTDLVERLEPGGYLFVTVPNAANARKRIALLCGRTNYPSYETWYWWPSTWRGHIREYVRRDLEQLASYLDLEIVHLHGAHHLLAKLPVHMRLAHQAVSAVFDGLRDSWLFVGRKPAEWKPHRDPDPETAARLLADATPYRYG